MQGKGARSHGSPTGPLRMGASGMGGSPHPARDTMVGSWGTTLPFLGSIPSSEDLSSLCPASLEGFLGGWYVVKVAQRILRADRAVQTWGVGRGGRLPAP